LAGFVEMHPDAIVKAEAKALDDSGTPATR
jgi:hypothetical protein